MEAMASRFGPQLKGVRVAPAAQGTQVILDLSSIPEDLKIQSANENGLTATFTGELAPGIKPEVKRFAEPNLQQVYWEKSGNKVQVFLKMKLADATTYYPLRKPDRLVFNVRNSFSGVLRNAEVTPGVKHTKLYQSTGRGPILINVLEVDPKNPAIEVMPALANGRMVGKARAATITQRNNAIAGINGSFFKPDQGIPLGLLIINEELVSGPLYERVALGITARQDLRMGRVGMHGELIQGGRHVKLDNVNQPRTAASQVVLYTSRWGSTAPKVPQNGIQIQLQRGQITAVSTEQSLPIPSDGYVVSGPYTEALAQMVRTAGQEPVAVNFYTLPDWSDVKHAISGGPYLVRNGQIYVDAQAQRFHFRGEGQYAPRSAVGITGDGKLLLVTVDGRQKGISVGVSLNEMARLMRQFGAVEAMNLDGGSSTQMVVEGRLVNSPSVANGVAVSNCLIIRHNTEAMRDPSQPGRAQSFNRSL
jgi:exopolysaccharide biosynthesis protein